MWSDKTASLYELSYFMILVYFLPSLPWGLWVLLWSGLSVLFVSWEGLTDDPTRVLWGGYFLICGKGVGDFVLVVLEVLLPRQGGQAKYALRSLAYHIRRCADDPHPASSLRSAQPLPVLSSCLPSHGQPLYPPGGASFKEGGQGPALHLCATGDVSRHQLQHLSPLEGGHGYQDAGGDCVHPDLV